MLVVSTSIAAYGVTPHIKSVSTVTGQDRPRPLFPAEPMRRKIKLVQETNVVLTCHKSDL